LYLASNLRSWLAIQILIISIVETDKVEKHPKNISLTLVLIDGLRELVECGGNLQSLKKNSLLTLDANVLWPLDEASKISLGLDVTTDSKVTSILLEERALNLLGATLGATALNDFLANLLYL
jgi:hypothetical protein